MSDTPRGPGWWQASDLKWYPPSALPPPPQSGWTEFGTGRPLKEKKSRDPVRVLIVILLAILGLIFLVGSLASNAPGNDEPAADEGPWTGEGKNLAQRACGDATYALREFSNGTRTQESTISELDKASDRARSATTLNAKWQPLAQAIVGSRNELATGLPGESTVSLIRNCGLK